jgi:hypothetical protein
MPHLREGRSVNNVIVMSEWLERRDTVNQETGSRVEKISQVLEMAKAELARRERQRGA